MRLTMIVLLALGTALCASEEHPRIGICGNDEAFIRRLNIQAASKKLLDQQQKELSELKKDREHLNWPAIGEVCKRHINEWYVWEAEQKRQHPEWFTTEHSIAAWEEEHIRYSINIEYLDYNSATLLMKDPWLVSADASASAWNVWPNQPYSLNDDASINNQIPRNGPEKTTYAYIHLMSACLVDRVEFNLVDDVPREIGEELKDFNVRVEDRTYVPKWTGACFVATVRNRHPSFFPYEVAITTVSEKEFAVKNVKVFGWTMDHFPLEVKRPRPISNDEAKRTAIEFVKSDLVGGDRLSTCIEYLSMFHIKKGMSQSDVENLLGPSPVTDGSALYEARDRFPNATNKKIYGTLRIGYIEGKVASVEFKRE